MKSPWIDSNIFKPENWSGFGLPFRANNDVEGWHHRMNKETKPNTPFYLLVQVLNAEAREIPINIELLSLLKFKRRLRKKYAILNNKIFKLWNQYERGGRSARKLLKACSFLVAGFE